MASRSAGPAFNSIATVEPSLLRVTALPAAPSWRTPPAFAQERIYEENASGGRWDRPELHRILDHLRDGDALVVWKLDRLSRSLKDLLHILEKIDAAGANFRSLTEATRLGRRDA
jgi:hypothetical protein